MRLLVTLFIVIGLISPLYAQTELLYEDFEGAAVGTPINSLGWTGSDGMVISDTLVDQGQSAGYTSIAWPVLTKMFDYSPSAEDQYVLTATLWAQEALYSYAHVQLNDSAGYPNKRLHMALGYSELIFGYIDETATYSVDVRVPQLSTPMDAKVVVSGSSFDAYWKANGDSEWLYAGHVEGEHCVPMSDFDAVQIIGNGGYPGGIDTVRLMALPPDALPGDANRDGTVDAADAALLALNWQTLTGATWGMGDFNEDGAVNDEDATILAVNWQTGVAQAAVPEPATIMLCVVGMATLFVLRRRS